MTQTVLKAIDLGTGYISKNKVMQIGHDINLDLSTGKLITLIGANGVGKSTLLRTLTGIQKPLKGKVLLNGSDVHKMDLSDLAQNLSVVLTEKLPPSNLTVFEIVALGRQPYTNWLGHLTQEDLKKINDALELTQIKHLAERKHYQISDGQLQKVLAARALAQDTPLIVLDEPTTHLDLLHKAALFKLLKKLTHETQKCVLFSTHDIDLAIQLSDEMIVMTPDSVVQDTPCNLIAKGIFNNLFNDEHIVFDNEKGKFIVI